MRENYQITECSDVGINRLVAASSFSFSLGGGSATVGAGSGAVGTSAPSCREMARGHVAALPIQQLSIQQAAWLI